MNGSDPLFLALVVVGLALSLRAWSLRRTARERAHLAEPGLLAQFARLPMGELAWVRGGLLALGVAALALASTSASTVTMMMCFPFSIAASAWAIPAGGAPVASTTIST